MAVQDLWKYCTQEQMKEMLLSFRLLEGTPVKEESRIKCLYAVSNHVEQHYHTVEIEKRNGGVRRLIIPDTLLGTIQKNLLSHVLNGLSISDYATAYKKNRQGVLLECQRASTLDIKDFFENITLIL